MIQAQTELPSVSIIIDAFAGIAALYLIRLVLRGDKKVDSLVIAWFGDPNSKEPNGASRKLNAVATSQEKLGTDFRLHVAAETEWQERISHNINTNNNRIHQQLTELEKRLPKPRRRRAAE